MSAGAVCHVCGHQNDLARVFCSNCGGKLDLSRSTPQVRRGGVGFRRCFRIVRTVVFLGLVTVLGLLVWPVEPMGQPGTRDQGRLLYKGLRNATTAIDEKQDFTLTATEPELNSYLAEIISKVDEADAQGSSGILSLALEDANLCVKGDDLIFAVSARRSRINLTYEITGWPEVSEKGFSMAIKRVRIGHFPLPSMFRARIVDRAASVFSARAAERKVLDAVDRFELQDGRIALIIESR